MMTLRATVGLPYSGKSTWARGQPAPIVCPDEIRIALHGQRYISEAEPFVWAIAKVMVRALFGAGHQEVILDATNTTKKRREEWYSGEWEIEWCVIDTPKEECIRRAQAVGDDYIIPIIEKMSSQWENPKED